MTANESCPTPEMLASLIAGELEPQTESRLVRHIDDCSACQRRMDQNAAVDLDHQFAALSQTNGDSPLLREAVQNAKAIFQQTVDGAQNSTADSATKHWQQDGYEHLRLLGRGGMGVVFLAREKSLDRLVAIKVLSPEYAQNETAKQRFLREARAAASIKHPNVITIHAVSDRPPLPYLVMEYVEGMSLQEWIDQHERLPAKQVIRLTGQIAKGLAKAHAAGIVHRDIKPANVLIERETNVAKITDFGLAQLTGQSNLTQTGVIVGTPAFIAPEVLEEDSTHDQRSDLFSLGSVMYAMCCGASPFESDSIVQTLHKIAAKQPPPIREQEANVPAWLEDVITKLLQKDPRKRFQSCEQLLAAIERDPTSAPIIETNKPIHQSHQGRRNQPSIMPWVIATGGVAIAAAATYFAITGNSSGENGHATVAAPARNAADENVIQRERIALSRDNRPVNGSTIQPPRPQTDELDVFVIRDDEGFATAHHDLHDAIEEAEDDCTIEIRTNNVVAISETYLEQSALTLRAADGFHPTLVFDATDDTDEDAMLASEGNLTLIGLRLSAGANESDEQQGLSLVRVEGGSFEAVDCEIRNANGPCFEGESLDSVVIRNCIFYSA